MSVPAVLLVAAAMAAGVVGTLVPGLPGVLLVWVAGLAWVLGDGRGAGRWTMLAVMTALMAAGVAAKYVLAGRRAAAVGAPRSTVLLGAAGALVGFFVVPVLGLVVGGVLGVWLAEHRRLRDAVAARRSTRAVLVGVGVGVLLEMAAALAMAAVWAAGELTLA